MLSIIWFIIKVIATIFLVLLCTLIFLLLVILLVPVRYHVYIRHGEEFYIKGTFSWLLHILHGNFNRKEEQSRIKVRLFGFVLYDNTRVKSLKRLKRNKSLNIRSKRKATEANKPNEEIRNDLETDNKKATNEQTIVKSTKINIDKTEIEEQKIEEQKIEERKIEEKKLDEIKIEEKTEIDEANVKGINIKEKTIKAVNIEDTPKKSIWQKLTDKIKCWIDNILDIKRQINLIADFIKEDINKQGFHLTFYSIRNLLKHILPKKLKSQFIFGTGDPCSTGQILGILGILYSIYGESITIVPDFENVRFEGEHDIRGRIRIGTISIIIIKLLLDKRFKEFKRNIKTLKEAL